MGVAIGIAVRVWGLLSERGLSIPSIFICSLFISGNKTSIDCVA